MTDFLSPPERSKRMSLIRGKDTGPELILRRALHKAGFRYRVHVQNLPGKPDVVLRKYRTIIFINGCFWHGHSHHRNIKPSSNAPYWNEKILSNRNRDAKNIKLLRHQGWRVLIVWECQLVTKKAFSQTLPRVISFLHRA